MEFARGTTTDDGRVETTDDASRFMHSFIPRDDSFIARHRPFIHSRRARAYIHPSIDANARVSRVVFFHGVYIDRSNARAVALAERSSSQRSSSFSFIHSFE